MANELEELLDFLSSPSPPVKKAAVDIVRDLTGSGDGLQTLAKYSDITIQSLSCLLAEKKEVSQNPELAVKMVSSGLVKTVMEILYKQEAVITNLLVMLLVNLTQLDAGIESLLQIGDEKMSGLYVMKLVRSFCTSSSNANGGNFKFDIKSETSGSSMQVEEDNQILVPRGGPIFIVNTGLKADLLLWDCSQVSEEDIS